MAKRNEKPFTTSFNNVTIGCSVSYISLSLRHTYNARGSIVSDFVHPFSAMPPSARTQVSTYSFCMVLTRTARRLRQEKTRGEIL